MGIDTRPIEEQGYKLHKIDNDKLAGRRGSERFNGSIIEFKGKILLAYRCYSGNHGRSIIGVSELDEEYRVKSNKELTLYSKTPEPIFEDPRLFVHKDQLHLSYIDLIYSGPRWLAVVRLCRLNDDLSLDHVIPVEFGNNGKGTEKNWNFFSHDDSLYFIYDTTNHHVIKVHDKTGKKIEEFGDRELFWPYGYVRGGTPPVKISDDEYLSFFHSSDYKAWLGRKYSFTPYTFSAKEPFHMKLIGKGPIIWGTQENGYCGSGNSQCVFPMGVLVRDDKYIVSLGINDTYTGIIEFEKDQVHDILINAEDYRISRTRYFYSEKAYRSPESGRSWEVIKSSGKGMIGVFATANIQAIAGLLIHNRIDEIDEKRYQELLDSRSKRGKQQIIRL